MNLKTEKIEQFIQIINRNLLLVQAGQESSVTPLDFRTLQKIDASIFGTDKFAYEMIHFVKSGTDNRPPEGSLLFKWETCFVKGLETLMVECGVVKDEIERDCLIGRVYCWFSEKISDRRELPRPPLDFKHLKESVEAIAPGEQTGSTMKALDNFEMTKTAEATALVAGRPKTADEVKASPRLASIAKDALMRQRENLLLIPDQGRKLNSTIAGLPVIPQILAPNVDPGQRPRSTPSGEYVSKRQQYENQITSLLPKLPTQESNYGMLYHKPESESEIIMHEMWLARRRQEAFDWKAQQQITLLMDRIGLHKSRVESEALRKLESGSYLSEMGTSSSMGQMLGAQGVGGGAGIGGSKSVSKFVPIINGDRPLSAKRHNAIAAREIAEAGYTSPGYGSSPEGGGKRGGGGRGGAAGAFGAGSPLRGGYFGGGGAESPMSADGSPDKMESPTTRTRARGTSDGAGDTMLSVTGGSVGREDTTVAKASRHPTSKTTHTSYVPMRFKNDHTAAKVHKYDRQHYYMQGSDSEDDDEPKERARTAGLPNIKSGSAPSATMQNSASAPPEATPTTTTTNLGSTQPRRARGPVHRERPKASSKFREVAFNDPEAKVHYRHSNYRRMPMTAEQTQWLAAQEQDRKTKAEEAAKAAAEAAAAAKKKKEEKAKGKKEDKGKGKKKDAKKEPEKPVTAEVKKSKYKSPAHFMAKNFPTFDLGEMVKYNPKALKGTPSMESLPPGSVVSKDGAAVVPAGTTYNPYSLGDITDDNYGPMKTMQMIECNRIMDVCEDWDVPMDPKVLYRALVIPQDKPYAITLEQGVHNATGGLMQNPMPKEHWKHVPPDMVLAGGKKKGGKKKKK
jgi:hypothetical protein